MTRSGDAQRRRQLRWRRRWQQQRKRKERKRSTHLTHSHTAFTVATNTVCKMLIGTVEAEKRTKEMSHEREEQAKAEKERWKKSKMKQNESNRIEPNQPTTAFEGNNNANDSWTLLLLMLLLLWSSPHLRFVAFGSLVSFSMRWYACVCLCLFSFRCYLKKDFWTKEKGKYNQIYTLSI